MAYDTNTARRNARNDAPLSTGNPFWDMMLSLGKASSQAMTGYAGAADSGARSDSGVRPERGTAQRTAASVEVIPVGEETLNVSTRQVQGETTRVRRVVVETPVEREVTLREERVIVERRKPTAATATATQGVLSEAALEMSDTYEVAEVWKSVRVAEEVVLRREVTERTERVRETVRRDEVTVEHAPRALRAPAPRFEAEAAPQERKSTAAPQAKAPQPQPEQLAADLKKVAERFEAGTPKAEPAQAEAPKAAEQPKAPATPARPEANGSQNDKGAQGRKA